MKTETLTATKYIKSTYNQLTEIVDEKGKVKSILNGYNQPRKGKKQIVINKIKYNLQWNKTIY